MHVRAAQDSRVLRTLKRHSRVSLLLGLLVTTPVRAYDVAIATAIQINISTPPEEKSLIDQAFDIFGKVGSVIGFPGTIAGAIQMALQILGIVESNQQQIMDQFNKLNQHIDEVAANLSWKLDQDNRDQYLALMFGAIFSVRRGLLAGQPVAVNSSIDVATSVAVQNSAMLSSGGFERYFTIGSDGDAHTDGRWKAIVDKRPQPNANNYVYDWRFAIPPYLNIISLRLAIITAIDPKFPANRL
jgi:hypothetical protein